MNQQINLPDEHLSYSQYLKRLTKTCHLRHYDYQVIGYELFENIQMNFPIYKININSKGKHKICLVAGVHGYEVAGPLSILSLLEKGSFKEWSDTSFTIFPIINPTSFDLKQRLDDDNRDLNACYKTTLASENYQEIKFFYKEIKNQHFDLFLSLHEDFDEDRFYTYAFEDEELPLYRNLIKFLQHKVDIIPDGQIYGNKIRNGLVINSHDHSLEDYATSSGLAKYSLATETPMKLALKERVELNYLIINFLNQQLTEINSKADH